MSRRIQKGNFLSIISQMAKEAKSRALIMAKEGLEACKDMDLIISGVGGLFIGFSLAEKFKIPFLQAYYIPFTPTKAFTSFLLSRFPLKLGGAFNRFSYSIARQMIWQGFKSADNLARQKILNLPPASFFGPYKSELFNKLPVLNGYSPTVIPKPSDWDDNIHVTGYWFLDTDTNLAPPKKLIDFIQSGSPPIYVGFGSMSNRDQRKLLILYLRL